MTSDTDTVVATPSGLRSTPTTPAAHSNDGDEDFSIAEWQIIALGWRDFQNDLRYAAQAGVRVWRMKVCVITSESSTSSI